MKSILMILLLLPALLSAQNLRRWGGTGVTSTWHGKFSLTRTATGQTATTNTLNVTTAGSTFNTTAGVLINYASYFESNATVSAGSFALTNIGVMGMATGGDNNWGIVTSNTAFTGTGKFYQSANNTTKLEGGPGTDNIAFGPDNRIRFNTPSVIIPSGSLSVGANSDDGIGTLQVYGKETLTVADSSASPANMLWRDPNTKELKLSAVPSGGITSINAHTGSAITIQSGTATSIDNSIANTVIVNVTPNSTALPHTLDAVYTTAGNTGSSETDLFSYTLPANKLAIDGRTVNFEIDGEFNDNTITAQLKLYFAGNVTLNTGAVSVSTAFTKWKLTGYIMRTSSSTAHVTYELQCPGLATPIFLSYNNLTSLDFTTTNAFKISAQAAGGGASNSDITAHSWQLLYKPQPQ